MYKLIVSGFDGVLIDSDEAINMGTVMKIDNLRRNGEKFCVFTDRVLQDILDYPASKTFFNEGKVKVRNITADALFNMGLTEEEIALFVIGEAPAVVITPVIEEVPYEEVKEEEVIIPIEEEVKEEIKAEAPVKEEALVTKKPAVKKSTNKKPATKKSSSLKTK